MRTGRVEANLNHLNEEFRLPYIPELIARKMAGAEQSALHSPVLEFHEAEYRRLVSELEHASERSSLQTESGARDELNDLLVRLRLQEV